MVLRRDLQLGSRPLEAARYAGAIDNVGGEVLAGLTRQVDFWGNIASVGLAGGAKLGTTVMPFILRGVNLLGINSSATRARGTARGVEPHRQRLRAAAPRAHRQPHDPVRRAAGGVPGPHRRKSYRSHSSQDRFAAVNFAA